MLTFPKLCWPPPHPWGELNKESLESTSSWPQKLVRCGQWHLKIVVKSILQWRFYPGKSFHPAVSLFQWSSTPSSSICRRSLFFNAIVLGSFLKFKLQSIRTLWKLINFSKNISQILAFLWALDGANKQLFLDQDCSISHTRKHCQSIGNAILMTIISLSNLLTIVFVQDTRDTRPALPRPQEKWLPRPRKFSRLPHPKNAPSLTVTPPRLEDFTPFPAPPHPKFTHCVVLYSL